MYVQFPSRRLMAGNWGIPARRSRRSCSLGDLSTVAATIQQIEGYYPGSLAYTNNNPGNLRPAGQPGCTPVGGFCSFPDYATGLQALDNQIQLDASRGLTIAQFTAKDAPAADSNNPTSYAASIAAAAGLSPSDPLSAALTGSGNSGDILSAGLPDLSSIDFTDPTTIAVLVGLGLFTAWALS
jgi:hypothetical protein